MKLRNLFTILLLTVFCQESFAQSNLLNAKSPEEIGVKTEEQEKYDNNKPLEYGYLADRDVLV